MKTILIGWFNHREKWMITLFSGSERECTDQHCIVVQEEKGIYDLVYDLKDPASRKFKKVFLRFIRP